MVQVASPWIKFHPKRQEGAEQIFPLQELKLPRSPSRCQGERGRDGQAPPCAPCPRMKQHAGLWGWGRLKTGMNLILDCLSHLALVWRGTDALATQI